MFGTAAMPGVVALRVTASIIAPLRIIFAAAVAVIIYASLLAMVVARTRAHINQHRPI